MRVSERVDDRARDCPVKIEREDKAKGSSAEETCTAVEVLHQGAAGDAGTLVVETSGRGRRRPVLNFVELHNGLRYFSPVACLFQLFNFSSIGRLIKNYRAIFLIH